MAEGDEDEVIHRLHQCLADPFLVDDHRCTVRISLGAVRPQADERAEDVLRRADEAMYESKRAQRSR